MFEKGVNMNQIITNSVYQIEPKVQSMQVKKVSIELPTAEDLAERLRPYFNIDIIISDDAMYQVSGIKNNR